MQVVGLIKGGSSIESANLSTLTPSGPFESKASKAIFRLNRDNIDSEYRNPEYFGSSRQKNQETKQIEVNLN